MWEMHPKITWWMASSYIADKPQWHYRWQTALITYCVGGANDPQSRQDESLSAGVKIVQHSRGVQLLRQVAFLFSAVDCLTTPRIHSVTQVRKRFTALKKTAHILLLQLDTESLPGGNIIKSACKRNNSRSGNACLQRIHTSSFYGKQCYWVTRTSSTQGTLQMRHIRKYNKHQCAFQVNKLCIFPRPPEQKAKIPHILQRGRKTQSLATHSHRGPLAHKSHGWIQIKISNLTCLLIVFHYNHMRTYCLETNGTVPGKIFK